jgi:hypothetical protein
MELSIAVLLQPVVVYLVVERPEPESTASARTFPVGHRP